MPATGPSQGLAPRRRLLRLEGLLVLATLLAGWLFVDAMVHLGERLERERGIGLARTALAGIDPDAVAGLRGMADDAGTPRLEAVRAHLKALRDANPEARFVYLMRPLDAQRGAFVFLADAEDVGSPDYSAPGDVYDGPDANLRRAWVSGEIQVTGAVADRWGEWVSVLAPIYDSDGARVGLLGVDVALEGWLALRRQYRDFGLAIAALVLVIVLGFLGAMRLQRKAARRREAMARELQAHLEALKDAQERLHLADMVVRHSNEGILVLDPWLKVVSANPGYERLFGVAPEAVVGRRPGLLDAEAERLAEVEAALAREGRWQGLMWPRRADGTVFPVEAQVEAVASANGPVGHHVLVCRDVTAQQAMEQRLRELSATDGLTGVANRRAFDEALSREWERALRTGGTLSLAMADIDYFKRYNDHFGHVQGDVCLRQVATALSQGVRQGGDRVARYGGEEFAVILPGASAAAAYAVAEGLRQRVEALALAHPAHPDGGPVTISIGVASACPADGGSATALVEAADRALYSAKAAGRNRVEQSGPAAD